MIEKTFVKTEENEIYLGYIDTELEGAEGYALSRATDLDIKEYNLNLAKKERQALLTEETSTEIYEKYSIHDQINITNQIAGYSKSDLDEMNLFIEEKILNYREKKDKIESAQEIEDLNF